MVGDPEVMQGVLLDWYAGHGRDLVIRRIRDPYAIWIAETMSQQTQIGRVGEALPAFLATFPDVAVLAHATVGEVLRAWGGLGYPRRALALRDAARLMVERFDGRVPPDVAALEALPGIGPYTARAVAATAFGVPVTALDVNARRVLGRVLGLSSGSATTGRVLQSVADALAPEGRAADWNHALMDLGATTCRPLPDHQSCPLRPWCASAAAEEERGVVVPAVPGRRKRSATRFGDSNRYVRGRILAVLRALPAGTWKQVDAAALSIEASRVERALAELHREQFIEISDHLGARLPFS